MYTEITDLDWGVGGGYLGGVVGTNCPIADPL